MSRTGLAVASLIFLWNCGEPAAQLAADGTGRSKVSTDSTVTATWPKAELLGQFEPAGHPAFERVPKAWTDKDNIYLRRDALAAYGQMRKSAEADGIRLLVRSATRNYSYQKGIWERKWERPKYMGWQAVDKAKDIMTYSAMPGASRHHWGTEVDLNAFENDWFTSGEGAVVYAWLQQHAAEYGFHQVYDDKSTGRTGYELERWHWSYLPISGPMLVAFNATISPQDLSQSNFSGSDSADSLNVLTQFVNGVNLPTGYSKTER